MIRVQAVRRNPSCSDLDTFSLFAQYSPPLRWVGGRGMVRVSRLLLIGLLAI